MDGYEREKPEKTPEELAEIAYLDRLRTCEGEAMPTGLPKLGGKVFALGIHEKGAIKGMKHLAIYHINKLTKIRRVGTPRKGHWEVV